MPARVLPYGLHGSGEQRVFGVHGWFADRNAFRSMRPHLDERRFSYAFADCRG